MLDGVFVEYPVGSAGTGKPMWRIFFRKLLAIADDPEKLALAKSSRCAECEVRKGDLHRFDQRVVLRTVVSSRRRYDDAVTAREALGMSPRHTVWLNTSSSLSLCSLIGRPGERRAAEEGGQDCVGSCGTRTQASWATLSANDRVVHPGRVVRFRARKDAHVRFGHREARPRYVVSEILRHCRADRSHAISIPQIHLPLPHVHAHVRKYAVMTHCNECPLCRHRQPFRHGHRDGALGRLDEGIPANFPVVCRFRPWSQHSAYLPQRRLGLTLGECEAYHQLLQVRHTPPYPSIPLHIPPYLTIPHHHVLAVDWLIV